MGIAADIISLVVVTSLCAMGLTICAAWTVVTVDSILGIDLAGKISGFFRKRNMEENPTREKPTC
jgi:hypothetical protein